MDHIPSGYFFHPDADSLTFGYPRVDIYLTGQPVERYFDAHKAIFPVAGGNGLLEMSVTHPWLSIGPPGPVHICAGRFHLFEPDGDTHYGFSLGGDLAIQVGEQMTVCTLTSDAPIFNLQDNPDLPGVLLADEFEALLARRRAAWGDNDAGYADRLASLDPLDLFIACLNYLEQDLHSLPSSVRSRPRYQKISHALVAGRQAVETGQRRPGPALHLEELL
jgi:hypothetical protein